MVVASVVTGKDGWFVVKRPASDRRRLLLFENKCKWRRLIAGGDHGRGGYW